MMVLGGMFVLWLSGSPVCAGQGEPEEEKPAVKFISLRRSSQETKLGDELTITAVLRNEGARVALLEVRLDAPEQIRLLAPESVQMVFVEPGKTQEVRWRAKLVGEGEWNIRGNFDVIAHGRPVHGTPPDIPTEQKAALRKVWAGTWASPTGFGYDTDLHLRVNADGSVEGRLEWTLRKVPPDRKDYADKIGLTGVEYVWGVYEPKTRSLSFDGYRRDDPKLILGLDRYRLSLSEGLDRLEGKTWNHGTWQATLRLTPKSVP